MYPCSPTYGCHGPGLYGGRLVGIVLGPIFFALLCLLFCWYINLRRRRRYFHEMGMAQAADQPVILWSPPWPRTNREAWYGSPDMNYSGRTLVARDLPASHFVEYHSPSSIDSRSLPPLPSPTYIPSTRSSHRVNSDFVGGFRMNATH